MSEAKTAFKTDGARRRAPGPSGVPVLGSLPEAQRKGMIDFYVNAWRRYGDVVRFQFGPVNMHLVAHPDHIRHVLLDNEKNYEKGIGYRKIRLVLGNGLFTSDGALWRKNRRIMGPPFTPRAVTQFGGAMTGAINTMVGGWEGPLHAGTPLNINHEMMNLAMSVIARTMLSMDIGQQARDAAHAFTNVLEFAGRRSMSLIDVPLFIPIPANRQFKHAIKTIDDFVWGTIRQREGMADPPKDLLTTLMQATDPETGEPMPRQQVRDEVLTIFFAGHETTAQALTWTWFLLSQHPEVEGRLQAEVDAVLGNRPPGVEDVPRLPYTRMVIEETMRLYPPVWVYVRDSLGEDEIGGYHVPGKSMIMLSQYITHRHPEFWENPERFDPENFAPERSERRHKFAYFPFGGGPRICLGNNFAMLEAVLAVAGVSQRYRLRLLPNQDIRPKMVGTLRPSAPVMMRLETR